MLNLKAFLTYFFLDGMIFLVTIWTSVGPLIGPLLDARVTKYMRTSI